MVTAADFRRIAGTFATGVTVITTRDTRGIPYGFTANAFTSLSLMPPQVLVCVDHRSDTYQILQRKGTYFAVNILSANQEYIARQFARKGKSEKFEGIATFEALTGAPLLVGTLSFIECVVVKLVRSGDHAIVVGEVLNVEMEEESEPLIFFRGSFCTCVQEQIAVSVSEKHQGGDTDVFECFDDLEGLGM